MFDFDDSDMLKPCPFCGSNVEIVECDEQPNEGGRVVQCLRCLTCSRVQFGEFINAHLIEAWNRRTYDAQIAALTAKLERVTELVARIDLQPWDCFSCGTNKAVRTDLFWTMSDTTEIAGTIAGLRALDEKTIAALQSRLAECERERDEAQEYISVCDDSFIEVCNERDTLRAQLTETQKLLDAQLAVGDKLTAEVARLKQASIVPGVMHCAKCNFELTRVTLYMGNGAVGPGDSNTEPCPNGCGPMWPVTWESRAREQMAVAERFFDEKQKAEAELAALRGLPKT